MNRLTYDQLCQIAFVLPAKKWDVRLIPQSDLKESLHPICVSYTRQALIKSYAFLKMKNANGYHVYGRPDATNFILIDDLYEDSLDQLQKDNLCPSAVVMTSKGNYQAWITVARESIESDLATAIARYLAQRYGGDSCSARFSQLGRLPGFTNRKEMYESNGIYPFTKLARPSKRGIPFGVGHLINEAQKLIDEDSNPPSSVSVCVSAAIKDDELAKDVYEQTKQDIFSDFGETPFENDRSRLDFMIAKRLMYHHFEKNDCAYILSVGSQKAQERGLAYVFKTVESAYLSAT